VNLGDLFSGSGVDLALGAGAAMVFVVAVAAGVRALLGRRNEVVQRLERVGRVQVEGMEPAGDGGAEGGGDVNQLQQFAARILRPFAKLAKPSKSEELSRTKAKLIRGGYRGENALEIFLGLKLFLAPLFTIGFLEINANLPKPMSSPLDFVIALWICAVMFFAPNLWLRSKISERQQAIERSLPDAMDLLVTCVEAGLGLDAALGRVSEEMALASPILGFELNHTVLEVQAGVPRADSFRRLAERTGLEDLRSLAAMLIQTEIFGTSVARALRVHADSMRIKRMQHAEEKAAMASVKMTIPLIMCVLPSLMAVVMGPAIVMITKSFAGTP
jgi:tight adherence protein C